VFAKLIMVRPVVTRLDMRVSEALETMRKGKFRMLPVVDREGRVCGIFSTFSVRRSILWWMNR